MPKIDIKVTISSDNNNNSYKIKSIIQDDIIKYREQDNTLVKYDLNKNLLIRENDNLRMEYLFDKDNVTEGNIFIKELNNNVNVLINTNKLDRINNNIDIEYVIEDNLFNYRIEEIK